MSSRSLSYSRSEIYLPGSTLGREAQRDGTWPCYPAYSHARCSTASVASAHVLAVARDHGGHGRLDHHDGELFRFSRGRAYPPTCPANGDAIRLRGSHCRAARTGGSDHQPPATRPGASRAESRGDSSPAGDFGVARKRAQRVSRRHVSIRQPARSGAAEFSGPSRLKLVPTGKKGAFLVPRDVEAPLANAVNRSPHMEIATGTGMTGTIAKAQASLERMEQRQAATLGFIEESYYSRAQQIRGVLTQLGLEAGKTGKGDRIAGLGGPFVAPREPKDANSFDRQLYRISIARIEYSNLTRALNGIPVRKPLDGEIDLMSGFGIRQDPFTGSPAMHTGLDLHGKPGDAVHASADGTVTAAGWSGGYGCVVDIDHGSGLSTRYAHLSALDVQLRQRDQTWRIVWRLGSTGRSTGPHLHYETRVKGEAVDPHRFLRAETKLAGII